MNMCGVRLTEPLLCSLGFHKWQNIGKAVEVFWQEPTYGKNKTTVHTAPSEVLNGVLMKRHEVVYEGKAVQTMWHETHAQVRYEFRRHNFLYRLGVQYRRG
jgi:hypothetical protein